MTALDWSDPKVREAAVHWLVEKRAGRLEKKMGRFPRDLAPLIRAVAWLEEVVEDHLKSHPGGESLTDLSAP